jgi:hypothetical protein
MDDRLVGVVVTGVRPHKVQLRQSLFLNASLDILFYVFPVGFPFYPLYVYPCNLPLILHDAQVRGSGMLRPALSMALRSPRASPRGLLTYSVTRYLSPFVTTG